MPRPKGSKNKSSAKKEEEEPCVSITLNEYANHSKIIELLLSDANIPDNNYNTSFLKGRVGP